MKKPTLVRCVAIAAALLASAASIAQQPTADAQRTADAIAAEVAGIRGLPLRAVPVETQSPERFGEYVRGRIDEAVPPSLSGHYDAIVRTLGLYRGPRIDDFPTLMSSVMASQAGAYYDPKAKRFYMLMTRMPELMQGVLYSHELYHALQDQHFDLTRYLEFDRSPRSLDSDQMLARQAVVEGEATYVMTLWTLQRTMGAIPPREMLAQVIGLQSSMSLEQMRAMIEQPQVAEQVGEDLRDAMKAAQSIPPFLLDEMIGAYMKGMGFVFAIQGRGWPEVEKLYASRPVRSTEQILHPEKWTAGDDPVAFDWPDLASVPELAAWELLDSDVLGEFRWRTVFRENGAADVAEAAAAGWDGDRYAVFKRKGSDAMLLLWRTAWDTPADAAEFAAAYRRVLASKYEGKAPPARVVQEGADVLIVEGGTAAGLDALVSVVRKARKRP